MKSSWLQFFLGIISAIVLIGSLMHFGLVPNLLGESYRDPALLSEKESPDGQYIARTERRESYSDWCEERTTVDRVGEVSDWEREYVFNIDCGSGVEVNWTGNRSLLISYGYDKSGKVRTYREPFSKDKQVSISYKFRNQDN